MSKLPFDQIGSGEFDAGAYVSNLSLLRGEVIGGEDINSSDVFQGQAKWIYSYERTSGTLYVWKEGEEDQKIAVFTDNMLITELSFTFNKRMDYFVIYKRRDQVFIYTYNSLSSQYEEVPFTSMNHPRVALTSLHPDHKNESQVVIGYVNDNNALCVRLEQDRFFREYVVKQFPKTVKLVNIGYNDLNRFQYEVLEAV